MQMFTCLGLSKEKSDDVRVGQLETKVCQLQEENKQLLKQIQCAPKSEVHVVRVFQNYKIDELNCYHFNKWCILFGSTVSR